MWEVAYIKDTYQYTDEWFRSLIALPIPGTIPTRFSTLPYSTAGSFLVPNTGQTWSDAALTATNSLVGNVAPISAKNRTRTLPQGTYPYVNTNVLVESLTTVKGPYVLRGQIFSDIQIVTVSTWTFWDGSTSGPDTSITNLTEQRHYELYNVTLVDPYTYAIDYQDTVSYCPASYTLSGPTCTLPPNTPDPQKNNDCDGSTATAGTNPCNVGTGNKYQSEVDYAGIGIYPLKLGRVYNNGSTTPSSVETTVWGSHWRGVYDRSIAYATNGAISTAAVKREGGKQHYFNLTGTNFIGDADVVGTLVRLGVDASGNATGWTYTNERDEIERYDASGKLVTITNRAGQVQTLTYSDGTTGVNGGFVLDATGAATTAALPAGRLIRVTDPSSRSLQYEYDVAGRVVKATDPAGGAYTYAYSDATSTANLTSVTYPDGKIRTYLYGEAANVSFTPNAGVSYLHSLTGIVDENGVRYASWTYDAAGRATSSEHGVFGSGIDRVSMAYAAPDASGNSSTTVVDTQGTSRVYGFSTTLGVVKNTGISGQPCNDCAAATTYDANGNIASSTDWNGNVTHYVYDLTRNLETSRTEAFGKPEARTITTRWHSTYRLPAAIAEPLRITSFSYDASGNLLSKSIQPTTDVTGASGLSAIASGIARTFTYTYNASGQVLSVNGPRTDVSYLTIYTYDTQGNLATVTNALNQITTLDNYDANGRIGRITDPNGLVTTLSYDARGRLTARTEGSETTSYQYDGVGQLTRITLPDTSTIQYTYDNAHRLTDITDVDGNHIHYTLDKAGNRTKEEILSPTNTVITTHDRVFNTLNQLYQDIGAANQTITYGYDNNGNLLTITDPLNHVTSNIYDALNRLSKTTNPNNGLIQYSYNGLDQLTQITDPRNLITQYARDGLDNLNQTISPDTGTMLNTYDAAGNLKKATDARGITTTYTYDALNRVTNIAYPTGTATTFEYDGGVSGAANAKGHLTKMSDESGQTTYTYNANGRLLTKTQTVGAGRTAKSFILTYAYSTTGKLSSLTYPSGNRINLGYDNAGRINSLTLNPTNSNGSGTNTASTINLMSAITYAPFAEPTNWTWGNNSPYTRSRDPDGRVSAYPLGDSLSNGLNRTLNYDAASRILNTSHTGSSTPAAATFNQSYSYDTLDRLTSFTASNTNQGYQYDASGNRTQATFGSTTYTNAIAATSNRLMATTGPSPAKTNTYDAAGNLTSDGTVIYTYSNRGRMASAKYGKNTTSYLYNGLGQRLKKTAPTSIIATGINYYLHDQSGHLLGEYDANGNVIQETVYLGDSPTIVLKQTTTTVSRNVTSTATNVYYIYADHLNTPRVLTRATDNKIVWRWDSADPFGVNLPNENPYGLGAFSYNPRFPGQIYDRETNLHYNYFRDYDPTTGRYSTSDPIGLRGGINTYSYVGGNPLTRIDPTGLDWIYSQSTGSLSYQPPANMGGGPPQPIGQGYAGYGAGLNNPAMQNVSGSQPNPSGPLPQGTYTIGTQQTNITNSNKNLPASMRLTPDPNNQMFGRDGFLIHGDNPAGSSSASEGCPILNRSVRNQIGNSSDTILRVIP